jgi:hypothetical protein
MFGLVEVRLMIYSMKKTAENLEARLKILGPESEDRVGIGNDLMLCHLVLEKLHLLEEEQQGELPD